MRSDTVEVIVIPCGTLAVFIKPSLNNSYL